MTKYDNTSYEIQFVKFIQEQMIVVIDIDLIEGAEELVMRKQTAQLRIDGPIGFETYKKFTDKVRDTVLTNNKTAPQPLNSFNPIRAGGLDFINLELIDTFV